MNINSRIKRFIEILHSFRTKVTMSFVLSLFFVVLLSGLLVYKFSLDEQMQQLRQRLMAIAQNASLMVDVDLLKQVPLERNGINSMPFRVIAQKLNDIKRINAHIEYIYIMTKTERPGIMQFVVDPNPLLQEGKQRKASSFPGDKYYASRFPEMLNGFKGPAADKKLMVDEWGVTISGYAPIKDRNGKAVAMLGVDMSAHDVYRMQMQVHLRAILVLLLGMLVSVGLGLFISKWVTQRIQRIVEGTRHIAADDLEFKLDVKGHDEISELASSFNKMAFSLSESKKKLQDYFYRVVQSLVIILEAKDAYTSGHSERVAGYAGRIAQSMGFSREKIELLKKAAQIHDIGKLVIDENILNKKSKLSEEEWKVMKQHPLVGEEVLKPILMDEEVMSMVRSHHERYDGKGYPDKLKGDNINIFAQIISVADAYDAMTSARAYRPALSKQDAIAELKNNCGSQFNTQVVKSFVKALEEEKG